MLLAFPSASVAATPAKPVASHAPPPASTAEEPLTGGGRIAAVVNGDVISEADISARRRYGYMSPLDYRTRHLAAATSAMAA
jgi:hypothetical protein